MAAFRLDDVFDGVFQRDDVVLALGVDRIDEGRECGRFAAADWAGDEDEAVVEAGEGFHRVRQPQFFDRGDFGFDDTEDHVDTEALLHDGGTEATEVGGISEIHVTA